jgi:lipopolysaccharide/colanic/teichoic acid biosynthesis glycosyltransferase
MNKNNIYKTAKRITDIILASLGIIVLLPVFLLISFFIKFDSRGPVFFRGVRTGKNNVPFRIFKFRSMYVGSEHKAGTTSRNDKRITKVGKFIRRYKLDELPQLLNVIKGEMSFVGPRPELPKYTNEYAGEELLILTVKPGITDIASIKFSNLNDLIEDKEPDKAFETRILMVKNLLRIEYVKTCSYWFDIKLIIKTVFKIILRK